MRFAYAALLLFLLWTNYLSERPFHHITSDRNAAARMAQSYFQVFMFVQFLSVWPYCVLMLVDPFPML